jgi:WD40 repeat protein
MCKLVFEPTGELLEAGVLANVPSLADPRDPSIEKVALEDAALEDFCLSPDGSRLLTAIASVEDSEYCGYVRSWSRSGASWLPLWTVRSRNFALRAVAFLPDSTWVLVVEENIGRDPNRQGLPKYSSVLTVREESTGELIAENSDVREFDDLQQVAVGGTEPVVVLGYPHELHIHKLAELIAEPPKRLRDLTGLASWWTRSSVSPRVIQTEWSSLRGLAFHPSGRFLLTVAGGPGVTAWDTETWTVTREFDWQTGNLYSVGVSGDGLLAAVGSDSGIVTIWDWEG